MMGDELAVGGVQCFPGPAQDLRIVRADDEGGLIGAGGNGGLIKIAAWAGIKQRLERSLSPCLKRGGCAGGLLGARREGVIEKLFEKPCEFAGELCAAASFDFKRGWRSDSPAGWNLFKLRL